MAASFRSAFAASVMLAATLVADPTIAQTDTRDFADVPEILRRGLTGSAREQYVAGIMAIIRQRGRDRKVIDTDLIKEIDDEQLIAGRARIVAGILQRDRDGDGIVTRQEVVDGFAIQWRARPSGNQPQPSQDVIEKHVQSVLVADADGDGTVTLDEALAYAAEETKKKDTKISGQLNSFLALDPNNDGRLTADELEKLALDTFDRFDRDGDRLISSVEMKALRDSRQAAAERIQKQRKQEYEERRQAMIKKRAELAQRRRAMLAARQAKMEKAECLLPPSGPDQIVLMVGAYRGARLSPVAIAGSDDVTTVIGLTIEPGSEPVYLIASAHESVIWQVEGATDRVARMIVMPTGSDKVHAVAGIDRDRVTFLPPSACFRTYDEAGSAAARFAEASIRTRLGRDVDGRFGARKLRQISLPSGKIIKPVMPGSVPAPEETGPVLDLKGQRYVVTQSGVRRYDDLVNQAPKAPDGIDQTTWWEYLRFNAEGAVELDPNAIVAPGQVEAYSVLPQMAGILQLMRDGALERLPDRTLAINKPIEHLPAGLNGAIFQRFLLRSGVPVPGGNLDRFCIILQETGEPMGDSRACR